MWPARFFSHITVEDLSVASIDKARVAYLETDLAERLARHHEDADAVFWRWNRIWLSPQFRSWSIEGELPAIRCPLLAVQGQGDEYGTLEQIRGIARRVAGTQLLELAECGHGAHRDQPQALLAAAAGFVRQHLGDRRAR
jgi:pimeloyl-ACP methyl ester carboxylesterase